MICDCGGMVYTADLKSAAFGIEGSSPSSRTKVFFKNVLTETGNDYIIVTY